MNGISLPPSDPTMVGVLEPREGRFESGLHYVVIGHLVMGVTFLGFVLIWGAFALDWVDGSDLRWLAPLPWLVGGAAGLLGMALNGGPDRRRRQQGARS